MSYPLWKNNVHADFQKIITLIKYFVCDNGLKMYIDFLVPRLSTVSKS